MAWVTCWAWRVTSGWRSALSGPCTNHSGARCRRVWPHGAFGSFVIALYKTWSRSRRVVAKAEYLAKGANPRFVVTNLNSRTAGPQALYEDLYCARGEMENRIKEQQLGLFADRTSTATLCANQLRLYLSSFAYVLMHGLRRLGLAGTRWAKAQCTTIRAKLLKLAASVRITTRKVWLSFASGYPYQNESPQCWPISIDARPERRPDSPPPPSHQPGNDADSSVDGLTRPENDTEAEIPG